ncbi:MAG: cobalamin biosynthesis protein CobD, partial [Thermodesulfobacteria bacterium]|nr:cobalamin biosynthesis protein CobD [Thermodesulfobacteriota bacterium]
MFINPAVTVLLAFLADQLLGDPRVSWHPVRLIGVLAEKIRPFCYSLGKWGGALIVLLTSGAVLTLVSFLSAIFPPLEALLLYFWIAEKSLREEVERVGHLLRRGLLEEARHKLSYLVGRETKDLSLSDVVRAAVETTAENFTDSLVGPLFWYLFGGILGVSFYKVVETLDSMYGYKTPPWKDFGFFPAKLDDVLNFFPARIAGFFLALAALVWGPRFFWRALRVMLKDARRHDSPNSGFTEAAMAGALGIELGGPVVY